MIKRWRHLWRPPRLLTASARSGNTPIPKAYFVGAAVGAGGGMNGLRPIAEPWASTCLPRDQPQNHAASASMFGGQFECPLRAPPGWWAVGPRTANPGRHLAHFPACWCRPRPPADAKGLLKPLFAATTRCCSSNRPPCIPTKAKCPTIPIVPPVGKSEVKRRQGCHPSPIPKWSVSLRRAATGCRGTECEHRPALRARGTSNRCTSPKTNRAVIVEDGGPPTA